MGELNHSHNYIPLSLFMPVKMWKHRAKVRRAALQTSQISLEAQRRRARNRGSLYAHWAADQGRCFCLPWTIPLPPPPCRPPVFPAPVTPKAILLMLKDNLVPQPLRKSPAGSLLCLQGKRPRSPGWPQSPLRGRHRPALFPPPHPASPNTPVTGRTRLVKAVARLLRKRVLQLQAAAGWTSKGRCHGFINPALQFSEYYSQYLLSSVYNSPVLILAAVGKQVGPISSVFIVEERKTGGD